MTLRDEMAELMPGLKWEEEEWRIVTTTAGIDFDVRVHKNRFGHRLSVFVGDWCGQCQSPAHAAKIIRRKLVQRRDVLTQAVEAARKGGDA